MIGRRLRLRGRLNTSLFVKLACSAALLALLLHFIPVGEVVTACASIHPLFFAVAVCLQFLTRGVAACRLKIVADSQGMLLTRWMLFRILLITQLYSLAMPGTLAGGGVTWLKYVQAGTSKDAAAATVVLNRAVGLTFMVLVGSAAWVLDRGPDAAWLLAGGVALTLLIVFLCKHPSKNSDAASASTAGWSWKGALANIRSRGRALRSLPMGIKLRLMVHSLTHELLGGAVMLAFGFALGLEIHFVQVLWMRAGMTILLMMPVSVAGLGVREVSLVGLGSMIGIAPASAVAWSFVTFAGVLIVAGVGAVMEMRGSSIRLGPQQSDQRQ